MYNYLHCKMSPWQKQQMIIWGEKKGTNEGSSQWHKGNEMIYRFKIQH